MTQMDLYGILGSFKGLSLEQLDAVRLQNRVDSKFVFSHDVLGEVLSEVSSHYNILDLDTIRSNEYRSLYFDTIDDQFFLSHHNGKLNRNKVRYRQYMDSGLCFLEVKFKNNKERTIKGRMRVPHISEHLDEHAQGFIDQRIGRHYDLRPALYNTFERMTFAHKNAPERLTIDHHIVFSGNGREADLSNICIAELKQEKLNYSSVFMKIMRHHGRIPSGMSKYCIGSLLLRDDLKYNNFKQKLLTLNRLSHGIVPAYR